MKLLLISSEYPPGPGGIGHHAYSLTTALSRQGHEVVVLTVTDFATEDQVRAFDLAHDLRIIRFPRIGWRTYLKRIQITHRTVAAGGFDRIILTGKFSLWLGCYLKIRFPGIQTLAIVHGSEVNPAGWWVRKLTHRSLQQADRIVSVSRFTTSLLPHQVRQTKEIDIIPNGIDTALLEGYQSQKEITMKGSPRLLTVGHVSPRKGQHRVIAALPTLRERFPDLHYHIVGRPVDQARLTALAERLGVADMITFHGIAASHHDLSVYYRQADIFMLLSENQPNGDVEGFGIVALEANFFGLPVIGALHCGVEDAVDHGQSGFLVDGNDATDILKSVESCMENREDLSAYAKTWALRHEWDHIVHQFLNVLK
jgi:phosphatidylinositol alpha-1,6-mannosyltransferase